MVHRACPFRKKMSKCPAMLVGTTVVTRKKQAGDGPIICPEHQGPRSRSGFPLRRQKLEKAARGRGFGVQENKVLARLSRGTYPKKKKESEGEITGPETRGYSFLLSCVYTQEKLKRGKKLVGVFFVAQVRKRSTKGRKGGHNNSAEKVATRGA